MSKKTNRKALEKLAALYATLPTVACKGLCAVACGPLPMSVLEAEQLKKADTQRRLPMIRENVSCIYLNEQTARCTVYAARPFICRVWGTVKNLSCMHGCVPDRWLGLKEFLHIAQTIERLGGGLVISSFTGLTRDPERTFLDISQTLSDEQVELSENRTRSLRALHGGRIVAAAPGGDGQWINLDKKDDGGVL